MQPVVLGGGLPFAHERGWAIHREGALQTLLAYKAPLFEYKWGLDLYKKASRRCLDPRWAHFRRRG